MRLTLLLACVLVCSPLLAQGLHSIGSGLDGLRLTQLTVRAEVQDQAATTELVQTIRNDTNRVAEALWLLPLPEGATADGFTMTANGVELAGEVLDGQTARRIYQDIVRRKRDPGLLEYAGRGALRARIFPIPAHGTVEVKVRYRQVLPQTGGLHMWSFPLRSAAVGRLFAENTVVDLRIVSSRPIRNLFSPLPGIDVVQRGDHEARVSLEVKQMPDRDLEVYFGLEEKDFGLNLLTWRRDAEPGYFAMILAPKRDWPEQSVAARSIKFVVDTSGSMAGTKMEQARDALEFFVGSLRQEDRFDIVSFASEAESLFQAYVPVTDKNLDAARQHIEQLVARGGTNLAAALEQALTMREPAAGSLPVTVLLTDGAPTVGITGEDEILALVRRANDRHQRVFVFGVGHDLNTRLLDRIAEQTRGSRDYVREEESIEVKTSALFTRLSHPVLTDLEIDCEGMEGFAIHPARLPDLFEGDRLVVLGRYRKPGGHTIKLRGNVAGEPRQFVYEGTFADEATQYDFVPPLWAERRVGMLLDAIRLHGEDRELLDEIRLLGREFGIVSPYTSHLILEEADRIRLVQGGRDGRSPSAGAAGPGGAGPAGGGRNIRYRGPAGITPPNAGGAAAAATRPGSAGPSSAGPTGPRSPGRNGPPGDSEEVVRALVQNTIVQLQQAGGLPKEANEEQLRELAQRLGDELMRSEKRLAGLGTTRTGREAVDSSLYLARFAGPVSSGSDEFFMGVGRRRTGTSDSIARLMTRRIAGHTFRLKNAVWVDTAYEDEMKDDIVRVKAFSDEYFDLLQEEPGLAPFFAFSSRIVVVLQDRVFEIE